MGTIAEKLTYLNTTKIKLRDSLNKFGSSILSTDTFRSYDTKLNDIYDKLPKVTQSGAEFTLSDVQNGQVDDFKMNGVDLEQDTTAGKNLCELKNQTITNKGVTFTIQDGVVTANGTYTANTLTKFEQDDNLVFNGNYIVKTFPISGDVSTPPNFNLKNSNGTTLANSNSKTGTSVTFSVENSTITTGVYAQANTVFDNFKFKVQIEEGSSSTDWEPYTGGIASPNPNYPQEITVVEGRQVITDKGKNLFDGELESGSYNDTTGNKSTSSNNVRNVNPIEVKPNTTYIFSINGVGKAINVLEYASDMTYIGRIGTGPVSANSSFTTSNNAKYISIFKGNSDGTEKWQIKEDTTTTDYEPYYNPVSYNIDLTNDLLKYNKCDFTPTTTSWYFLDSSGSAFGSNIGTKTNIKFPVEINKKYTLRYNISIVPNSFQLCYDNENIVATLEKNIGNNSFTFTSNRNGYVIPRVRVNASSQVKITGISVVEGEEDYYDYKLAKMPNTDYKNRIYKNNGNWYYEENVKKVVLDGSENWVKLSYSFYWSGDMFSNKPVSICSHFIDNGSTWTSSDENLRGKYTTTNATQFKCMPLEDMTLNEFKTWLSTNNVDVWCQLDNPITTQITNTTLINQLEAISVYTGTNIITISNDNNIIPEIEITRLKELEKLA